MMQPYFLMLLISLLAYTATAIVTSQSENTFVNECVAFLLAAGEDDGLISSSEYAAFWSFVTGTESDFNSLNIQLQLSFVWVVCGDPDTQKTCLAELKAEGNGFGYTLSKNSKAEVGQQIQGLCEDGYLYAINNELTTGTSTTYYLLSAVNACLC